MANAFGLVLDSASVRRAAVEGVPETVIGTIYLLHENSVDSRFHFRIFGIATA